MAGDSKSNQYFEKKFSDSTRHLRINIGTIKKTLNPGFVRPEEAFVTFAAGDVSRSMTR